MKNYDIHLIGKTVPQPVYDEVENEQYGKICINPNELYEFGAEYFQLTIAEMADIIGVAPESVKRHKRKGRAVADHIDKLYQHRFS